MQSVSIKALSMVLAALGVVTACSKEEPIEEVIRPVRYIDVKETPAAQTRTFAGTAKAGVEANLSFKVGGTVQRVQVKVGYPVSKGTLIAESDPADFELKVEEAQAGLAQARAEQRNAQANYERVQGLYENNNASRSDLDTARAGAESASASVRSIGKQLERARAQLGYTRLTAKDDCSIATVDVEVNENVSAGQRVAMVTCGGAAEVEVGVPESVIGRIVVCAQHLLSSVRPQFF
ncbi:MAG: efflux RND transporter periplasmic adaptor subunit [Gammaproteobacteria bacterium]|nr:efflux RND transporter periplasmic adaptor subunit [Gammaproteobacteria bacterium]